MPDAVSYQHVLVVVMNCEQPQSFWESVKSLLLQPFKCLDPGDCWSQALFFLFVFKQFVDFSFRGTGFNEIF